MSCRRGTPRNDCGCCKSLAEKVRELYQRCANAIKSINGINPDGANNFDILPGAGIQVNPRANGIEIVATGAAPQDVVKTINSEGPDSDGNFAITAGSGIQINTGTNGLEIENTSQGAVYTGVSPITINSDNEIGLADWEFYSSANWSIFLDANNRTTEELYIILDSDNYGYGSAYIPKGIPVLNIVIKGASNNYLTSVPGLFAFTNNNLATINYSPIKQGLVSGSGYLEVWNSDTINPSSTSINKATNETSNNRLKLYRRR